jgi:hypothetical protein
MAANWNGMGEDYREAACSAVVKHFRGNKRGPHTSRWPGLSTSSSATGAVGAGAGSASNHAQAVANIIYSLGGSGALWEDFPDAVRETLTEAFMEWSPDMSSQELSNLCYG